MLRFTTRIRDLVHGSVPLTTLEMQVINHPFFQRLRHIRQNDVAVYVYPSLNVSRFEHLIGTCHVAGKIAGHLVLSPKWRFYFHELKTTTGITSPDEFITLARLYALIHDVGHFPLSHLFEFALQDYARSHNQSQRDMVLEWTKTSGFDKPHEAIGAIITRGLARDIHFSRPIRNAIIRLMTEKTMVESDPLYLIKVIVDAEIDADRIDFVRRDGLLAGGEYGNYDIDRLCGAAFIERDDQGWLIAYSEKALTSIEALLLDRYRTHVWIHFHHRVVATKLLVQFLIGRALDAGLISPEHFNPAHAEEFALRDDIWLWGILRMLITSGDETAEMIKRAVLLREKKHLLNLWKSRPAYQRINEELARVARIQDTRSIDATHFGLTGMYESETRNRIGAHLLRFRTSFTPVGEKRKFLYSEGEKKLPDKHLTEVSRLLASLNEIAKGDPQYFVLLVGRNIARKRAEKEKDWITLTAQWMRR
jgi:HD superfamily phosphohydrolase